MSHEGEKEVTHVTHCAGMRLRPWEVEQNVDQSAVRLRPIEPADAERLRRLFRRLSPRTVYLRFFGPVPALSEPMLRHLAVVDHDRRQALVAVADGETVGVARYDRDPADLERAEVAIVVEDAWQGRGLGKVLLTGLAEDAQRHGVKVLTASVLGENRRALELARNLAPATTVRLDQGEWLLEVPLRVPPQGEREGSAAVEHASDEVQQAPEQPA